jgi:putative methionine-R-sulfoxide reductase with GAF domain
MSEGSRKDFFDNVSRSIKISYFIGSIIPLALLVYFSVKYIYPIITKGRSSELPIDIGILLVLAVFVSILGLTLSLKATNASIMSIKQLHGQLNSLFGITKQFRTTPYLDLLLEDIVKSAIRLTSTEAGSLILYDDENTLRFKVLIGKGASSLKGTPVRRGKGFSGSVADTGQALRVNDVKSDERFTPEFDKISGFKTRSIMCAPLIHMNSIIGVIEVLNKRAGEFSEEDEKLLQSLADQAAISISQSTIQERQKSDVIQITSLLVETQDRYSQVNKGHAKNVAKYVNIIGKKMALSEDDLKTLYYASLFHDIGFLKIQINDPGNLTPQERENVKNHPRYGYELLRSISIWSKASEIILHHHERYDGKGYPLGKKGREIPLGSRILFVAEVFDVITNNTSYREQLNLNTAFSEIEANSGLQFDPEVVKAFKQSLIENDMISG